MNRSEKAQEITSLSERFGRAKAAFLIDFKGMTVEQVTQLRKKLRPTGAEMKVVRNTLALRALKDHPATDKALSDSFVGTNAVVFAFEEAAAPAKVLADFAKDIEQMQLKSGVMDGRNLSEAQVKQLASLPGKNELRAQLLGVLSAPMSKFLGTLQAVPGGFARVLNAYKEKQEPKS